MGRRPVPAAGYPSRGGGGAGLRAQGLSWDQIAARIGGTPNALATMARQHRERAQAAPRRPAAAPIAPLARARPPARPVPALDAGGDPRASFTELLAAAAILRAAGPGGWAGPVSALARPAGCRRTLQRAFERLAADGLIERGAPGGVETRGVFARLTPAGRAARAARAAWAAALFPDLCPPAPATPSSPEAP